MSLTELKTFYDRFEAEIVCGRLRAEGLEALVFDAGLSASYGGGFPVRLMVLEEDRPAALRLLAQEPAQPPVDRGPWGELED